MFWPFDRKSKKNNLRKKLIDLNDEWSDLTKDAIIQDFAQRPDEEIGKLHEDIEDILDKMYRISQNLRELGDNEWLDEFRKQHIYRNIERTKPLT